MPIDAPLQTGAVLIGRYRIVKMLGQGGFGAVYKAWDTRLNAPCAVKENFEIGEEAARQFAREASILANLRHPNLPKVMDHFSVQGQGQYLVMEYVEGEDLQTKLEAPVQNTGVSVQRSAVSGLPEAQVLPWFAQICDALTYLHTRTPPIIHRDLKPANIRICPDGTAMLVDFGIAKLYDPLKRTTLGARAVTPGYAPFEQYGQEPTDSRTDVYALGATVYTALTGQTPVESIARIGGRPLPTPRSLNPAISIQAEAVILKAMALLPDQRFQSAAELKAAVSGQPSAVNGLPSSVAGHPSTPPPAKPLMTVYPTVQPTAAPQVAAPGTAYAPLTQKRRLPWGWIGAGGGALALLVVVLTVVIGSMFIHPTPTVDVHGTLTALALSLTRTPTATPKPLPITATPTLRPGIGSTLISPKDGMTLVYVPAGDFTMGSNDGADDEKPIHTVYLDAYWIDQVEVTNAMFAEFVAATDYQTDSEIQGWAIAWLGNGWVEVNGANWQHPHGPSSGTSGLIDYPVVQVSWNDAKTYCEWAGRRLPTEAEWEKAARGTDERIYPWGNKFDCRKGNFDDETQFDSYVVPGGPNCDNYLETAPVGSFQSGVSPYQVYDMAGNVWEWINDWYVSIYYLSAPYKNPTGPSSGSYRGLRGGSWYYDGEFVRTSDRYNGIQGGRGLHIGFRCAASP